MELWPHLEMLEIVTCEVKDCYPEPEIQQLVLCSNLKIISLAIYMMKKIQWGGEGKDNIFHWKHIFSTEKKSQQY